MRYSLSVLMDCPQCLAEAELIVHYEGVPSRYPCDDSTEVRGVDIACENGCGLTAEQQSILEEEAIAIAHHSPYHSEVMR
jgi:hypothetical protein